MSFMNVAVYLLLFYVSLLAYKGIVLVLEKVGV